MSESETTKPGRHKWSGKTYTSVDDIKINPRMNQTLNLTDMHKDKITELIKDASAEIEEELGEQMLGERMVSKLARHIVWLDVARGAVIAEQTGDQRRISRMGLVPGLEREIRRLKRIIKNRPRVFFL